MPDVADVVVKVVIRLHVAPLSRLTRILTTLPTPRVCENVMFFLSPTRQLTAVFGAVTVIVEALNVKPFVSTPVWPSGFVTVTLTAPPACAGVLAVMVVLLTTTTLVAAAPPIITVAPAPKLLPEIVTVVPPPGEYTYVCLISGHYTSMVGTLRSLK